LVNQQYDFECSQRAPQQLDWCVMVYANLIEPTFYNISAPASS